MAEPRLISTADQLDELFAASHDRPVFIFKHSLTCPISSGAHREYRSFIEQQGEGTPALFALIEIQNARPISQAVAERTGIRHESPQAILLKGGDPVWNSSHWRIKVQSLGEALDSPVASDV